MAVKTRRYEYEVVYIEGSSNTNADALSRIHLTEGYTNDHESKVGPTKEESKLFFRNYTINRSEVTKV